MIKNERIKIYPDSQEQMEKYIGDLCFKGIEAGCNPEIGYGILEEYRGLGFAIEAVKLALKWAFRHPMVKAVEAEADSNNAAS